MHDGPSHAPERRPSAGPPSGRRPILNPDPIEHLTDLFLGDLGAPSAAPDPDDLPLPPLKPEVESARRRADTTHVHTVHSPRTADQPSAAFTRTPAHIPAHSTPAAHDPGHTAAKPAATKLRFSDPLPPAPTPPTQPTAAKPASVEVIIVGHLPVAAAPWVHQYARHRQRTLREPVALLRWRGASMSVDLLGEPAHLPLPACPTPALAIAAASRLSHLCQVSVDETMELDAATLAGVERVTILSGVHDTALVACYRALKGLTQHDSIQNGRCSLAVVIIGGPDDRAKAAASRLERTAATFLAQPLLCEIVPDKIAPARSTTLFAGPATESPLAAIKPLLAQPTADQPAANTDATPAEPAAPATQIANQSANQILVQLAAKLPGLRPVEIRCPFAPAVELAISDSGDLHVVTAAPAAPDVPRAVADLTVASAWVRTNTDAIRKAIPELAARTGALAPSEHLVTAEPRAVRGLLDSRLKLHAQAGDTLLDLN